MYRILNSRFFAFLINQLENYFAKKRGFSEIRLRPSHKIDFFSRNIQPEIPLVTVESSSVSADILSKIEGSQDIFSYTGNLTHWVELGGHLEFPKTITFKVNTNILYYMYMYFSVF